MIEYTDDGYRYPVAVQRFDHMTEFYAHARRIPRERWLPDQGGGSDHWASGNRSFYGHPQPDRAADYCEKNIGPEHMRAARELMEKVDVSFRDRERNAWHSSPMGAYPIVPDYLANDPFSMRMKAREEHDQAPIRYYIECIVSAGVRTEELERRATAIAALIMRSVEERSVELYAFIAMTNGRSYENARGYVGIVPIQTHPIDLHSAIAALATREFCRSMAFASCKNKWPDTSSSLDWLYGHPTHANQGGRADHLRRALRMDPQDVLMQGGYLWDAYTFSQDPVKWVHEQVEKQRSLAD